MKKFTLTIVAALAVLFCLTANSQAGVGVGIVINGGGPGYYGGYYGPRYSGYYNNCAPGYGYYGPRYYRPYHRVYYPRPYYRPSYGVVIRGR